MKIGLIIGFAVIGLFLVGTLGYLVFLPMSSIHVSPIVIANIPNAGMIPGVLEVVFVSVTGIGTPNIAISQSVQESIVVTFDEAINSTTINSSTFMIKGPNNVNLKGQITPDSTQKIWTLNPTDPLKLNTAYNITITKGVKGVSGDSLSEDFFASFRTITT